MDIDYQVIVIGAGIAGCAAAYALGQDYKVLLIERDWSEPDRIVGELLQPGGINALHELGMEDCTQDIDGIRVDGYAVFKSDGNRVVLPYPEKKFKTGVSFHHGKFIMKLREKAKSSRNVTCLEGTAVELLQCKISGKYLGTKVKVNGKYQSYFADLTVVADGCFSAFRKNFINKEIKAKSHFAGLD